MGKFIDLTGERFGRLTVVSRSDRMTKDHQVQWNCVCDCGTPAIVRGSNLRNGSATSCGCYRYSQLKKSHTTHNKSKTKLMRSWYAMRQRCLDPNSSHYKDYGGRGIKICEEWNDSVSFIEWAQASGYKDGLTLDRIDVNGNYSPQNCRWATSSEQANNTRRSIIITYNGKTQSLKLWCDELGLNYGTISSRINQSHWDPIKALTTPLQKNQFG